MSDYTRAAVDALTAAVTSEPDWPGWLANVVSTVADRCGGSGALTRRPGSWEAGLVTRLAEGGIPVDTKPCAHTRIDLPTQLLALNVAAAVVNGDNNAAARHAERAGCPCCLTLCLMHLAVGLAAEVSGDNTWPVSTRLTDALLTAITTTERELRDTYN